MMLDPTKWRILMITAGLLLAHATESPTHQFNGEDHGLPVANFVNSQLGIRLEELDGNQLPRHIRREAQNLLPPYHRFSIVDNIRYRDSKSRNSRRMPETFGSFRIVNNESNVNNNNYYNNTRRIDRSDSSDLPYKHDLLPAPVFSTKINDSNFKIYPSQYNYIPIQSIVTTAEVIKSDNSNNNVLPTTNPFIQQINDDIISQISESATSLNNTTSQFVTIETDDNHKRGQYDDYTGPSARRSGFKFPDAVQPKFVPKGYSEDRLAFGENLGNSRPYFDEHLLDRDNLKESNEPAQLAELLGRNRFHTHSSLLAMDDPVFAESSNHPVLRLPPTNIPDSLAQESSSDSLTLQRQSLRTYPTIYYQGDFRPSRHYFPPKIYTEFNDFPVVAKSKFPPSATYKSRSPRVIFPIPDGIPSGPTGSSSPYSNDNIVFR